MADDIKVSIKAEDKASDVLEDIQEGAEAINESARDSANKSKQSVDRLAGSYDQLLSGARQAAEELLKVTKQVIDANQKLDDIDFARDQAEFEEFEKLDNQYEELAETIEELTDTQEKLFLGMREGLKQVNGYVEENEKSFKDYESTFVRMATLFSSFENQQMELDTSQGIKDINSIILAIEKLQSEAKQGGQSATQGVEKASKTVKEVAKNLADAVDEIGEKSEGALTDLANEFGENLPNQIKEFLGLMDKVESAIVALDKATEAEADNEDGRRKNKLLKDLVAAEENHKQIMEEQTKQAIALKEAMESYVNPLRKNKDLTEQQVKALAKLSALIYSLRGDGANILDDVDFEDTSRTAINALKAIFAQQEKVTEEVEKTEQKQEELSDAAEGTLNIYNNFVKSLQPASNILSQQANKFVKASKAKDEETDGRKLRRLNRELAESIEFLNNAFLHQDDLVKGSIQSLASLMTMYQRGEVSSETYKEALKEFSSTLAAANEYTSKMAKSLDNAMGAQFSEDIKNAKNSVNQLSGAYKAAASLIEDNAEEAEQAAKKQVQQTEKQVNAQKELESQVKETGEAQENALRQNEEVKKFHENLDKVVEKTQAATREFKQLEAAAKDMTEAGGEESEEDFNKRIASFEKYNKLVEEQQEALTQIVRLMQLAYGGTLKGEDHYEGQHDDLTKILSLIGRLSEVSSDVKLSPALINGIKKIRQEFDEVLDKADAAMKAVAGAAAPTPPGGGDPPGDDDDDKKREREAERREKRRQERAEQRRKGREEEREQQRRAIRELDRAEERREKRREERAEQRRKQREQENEAIRQQTRLLKSAADQQEQINRESKQTGPKYTEEWEIRDIARETRNATREIVNHIIRANTEAEKFNQQMKEVEHVSRMAAYQIAKLGDVNKQAEQRGPDMLQQVQIEGAAQANQIATDKISEEFKEARKEAERLAEVTEQIERQSGQRGPNMLQQVQIEGAAQANQIATQKIVEGLKEAAKVSEKVAEEQEKVADETKKAAESQEKVNEAKKEGEKSSRSQSEIDEEIARHNQIKNKSYWEQLAAVEKKRKAAEADAEAEKQQAEQNTKAWKNETARVNAQVAATDKARRLARQELQLKLKMRSITDINEVSQLASEYDAVGDALQLVFANYKNAITQKEKFHKGKESAEQQRLKKILENLRATFLLTKSSNFGFDKMHKLATEFQHVEGATYRILQTYEALNKQQATYNRKVETAAKAQERQADAARKQQFEQALKFADLKDESDVLGFASQFSDISDAYEKSFDKMTRSQKEKEKQDKQNKAAAERLRKELSSLPGTIQHLDSAMSKINVQFYTYTNILQDARFGVQQFARHMRDASRGIITSGAQFETFERGLRIVESGAYAAQKRLDELLDISDRLVGLETTALIKYSNQLRAAGVSAKDSNIVIEAVAKSLSEMGKGTVESERVLRQLTQGIGGNKIVLQDLRPIIEEIPRLWNAASVAFEKNIRNVDAFRDAVSEAGLEPSEGLLKVIRQLGITAKGASMDTYAAQIDILIDRFTRFKALLGRELLPTIISILKTGNQFLQWFNELPSSVKWIIGHLTAMTAAISTLGSGLLELTFILITAAQSRKIYATLKTLAAAHVELFAAQKVATAGAVANTAAQNANTVATAANTQATATNAAAKGAQSAANNSALAAQIANTTGISANTAALLANAGASGSAIGQQSKFLTVINGAVKFIGRYSGWIGLAVLAMGGLTLAYRQIKKPAEEAEKANKEFAESVELVNRAILDRSYLEKRRDVLKEAVEDNKKLNELFNTRVKIDQNRKRELESLNAILGDNEELARKELQVRATAIKNEIYLLHQRKDLFEQRRDDAVSSQSLNRYNAYHRILENINKDLADQNFLLDSINEASRNVGKSLEESVSQAKPLLEDLTIALIKSDFVLQRLERSFSKAGETDVENLLTISKSSRINEVQSAYANLRSERQAQADREIGQLRFNYKSVETEGDPDKTKQAWDKYWIERYKVLQNLRDQNTKDEEEKNEKIRSITEEHNDAYITNILATYEAEENRDREAFDSYKKNQKYRTKVAAEELKKRSEMFKGRLAHQSKLEEDLTKKIEEEEKKRAEAISRRHDIEKKRFELSRPETSFSDAKTEEDVNNRKEQLEDYYKHVFGLEAQFSADTISDAQKRNDTIELLWLELKTKLSDIAKSAEEQINKIEEDGLKEAEKRAKKRFDIWSKAFDERQKRLKDANDAYNKWQEDVKKSEEKALKETVKVYDKIKNAAVSSSMDILFERDKSFKDIAKSFIKQSLKIIAQHYLETAIIVGNNKKKVASNLAVEASNNRLVSQLLDLKGLAGAPLALSVASALFPQQMGNLVSGIGSTFTKGFGKLFDTREADNAGAKSAIRAALGGASYSRQNTMTNAKDFGRVLGPMLKESLKDAIKIPEGSEGQTINVNLSLNLEGRAIQEISDAIDERKEQNRA